MVGSVLFIYIYLSLTESKAGLASNPHPKHERVDLIIYSVLIEHATEGLILFETGCHDDMQAEWGPVSFPMILYE